MSVAATPAIAVPVLIIGGGGCGLSASIFLADAGVETYLVERHIGTAIVPKAHILNPRTMEIFHQHGLDEDVYARGASAEQNSAMRWMTSLGGEEPWDRREILRVDGWGGGSLRERYAGYSAFRHGNLPQNQLEPLLKRHAEERSPGRLHFGHDLIALDEREDGVLATINVRETNDTYEVLAQYVLAADGGKTVGPNLLGIPMIGPEPFVHTVSVHFAADLSSYIDNDDACVRSFIRPNPNGEWTRTGLIAVGPDTWGRYSKEWVATVTLQAADEFTEYTEELAAEAVRKRLNLPELDLTVIRFSRWRVEGVYSERYGRGRIFLAGDAAHRHSPMGGLGLNSGIQDAHNLSWKLAAVVKGEADPALLTSYEVERQPIAKRNVEFATMAFFNNLTAASGFGMVPGAPVHYNREILDRLFADTQDGATRRVKLHETFWTLRLESRAADLELGFEYANSPAVTQDGTLAPPRDPAVTDYRQDARPGHRLPHAWLRGPGIRLSTHELLEPGRFLLLTGPFNARWCSALSRIPGAVDLVDVHPIGPDEELDDADGTWGLLRGHDDFGAVLVRPDGHVAYRGHGEEDAVGLASAYARALGQMDAMEARV